MLNVIPNMNILIKLETFGFMVLKYFTSSIMFNFVL